MLSSTRIQKAAADMFDIMSKGHFICSNSTREGGARLFEILINEEHYTELATYFSMINYRIEKGNNFFYFAKRNEAASIVEKKLETFEKYIDIIDLFAGMDNKITVGARFRPTEIAEECNANVRLKQKLQKIQMYRSEALSNKVKEICDLMTRDGYFEKEDDIAENYKVLDSYTYLLDLINAISIYEDPDSEENTKSLWKDEDKPTINNINNN